MTHNPISTPISLSHLFRLRRDERWMMLAVALLLVALNALTIIHYYGVFTPITDHYWNLFVGNFHISGFDPISYYVVSNWDARYNVYRHPLLAFMMWVPYLLNQALMWMTGVNCALFIMTAIQVVAAWYAFLFLYRLLVEVMGLARTDARLLSFFLYSFAFVMVTAMVPDHFVLSLCVLLFVLYYSGLLITRRLQMSLPAAIVLFVVTAGISLNNGLKVFLSGLVVNGRRFFRPKFLLLAVVVPALVIWVGARYEYRYLVAPGENARHAAIAQKRAEQKQEAQLKAQQPSSAQPSPAAAKPKPKRQPKKGKPFMQGEFMRWSDKTSPRVASVVENLFGESIQLHPDYLLQDQSRFRPMIIEYRWAVNYVVEAIIAALFLAGIWMGRRNRLLWLCLSWFGLDMLLHVGIGFALNEIYIMTGYSSSPWRWLRCWPDPPAGVPSAVVSSWHLPSGSMPIMVITSSNTCYAENVQDKTRRAARRRGGFRGDSDAQCPRRRPVFPAVVCPRCQLSRHGSRHVPHVRFRRVELLRGVRVERLAV